MKRVGLIFAILAITISSVTSVLFTQNVNALTGDADHLIQNTDTLKLYGTNCSIDVGFAGLVTDLIKNDSLWGSTTIGGGVTLNHQQIKDMWDNRTAFQVVQGLYNYGPPGSYTAGTPGDNSFIQVVFTDAPGAYNKINDSDPYYNGYPQPNMGVYSPVTGYNSVFLTFTTNSNCSTLNTPSGGAYPYTVANSSAPQIVFSNANTNGNAGSLIYATGGPIVKPSGYQGADPALPPSNKFKIFPTLSISIQNKGVDKNDIIMSMDDDFIDKYHLPNPDYILLTLTKYPSQEIIEAQSFTGPYPKYTDIPKGQYTVHLTVVYSDPNITDVYEFKDSFYNIDVNDTSFSIFYNENEGKYCSVRGGYEWNCQIPQPEDESNDVIDGSPEDWQPEECSITDIGACIRNALHYLGEYLGLNGPNIQPGTSMFFQYDGAKNLNGLASIVTAPITILTSLQNAQYTCNTVSLPMPFINRDLPLPCMHSYYTTYMGQLYTIWQTVINGIVAYWVIVGMLKMVKDAKDPKKDQIEVLNL